MTGEPSLPGEPLELKPVAVGKALTCGWLRPMPRGSGTATGCDADAGPSDEGAPPDGGEETVEACGIVSGLGMAVPTD